MSEPQVLHIDMVWSIPKDSTPGASEAKIQAIKDAVAALADETGAQAANTYRTFDETWVPIHGAKPPLVLIPSTRYFTAAHS